MNEKMINYEKFAYFLEKRFINKESNILPSISSKILALIDSLSYEGKLDYQLSLLEIERILPLEINVLKSVINFLNNEALLLSYPKKSGERNEVVYYLSDLFYKHKNDYIQMNEVLNVKEYWDKWFNDYLRKNSLIENLTQYILAHSALRESEVMHLQNIIYVEMLSLVNYNDDISTTAIKEKLYQIIDDYIRENQ